MTPREIFCLRLVNVDTSKTFHTIRIYHRNLAEYKNYVTDGLFNLRVKKHEPPYMYLDLWLTEKGKSILDFGEL